jgi:hypothetical protein
MITYRYVTIQDAGKVIPVSQLEHPAVRAFRDRVEALSPEDDVPVTRKYEGVAAARYELLRGKVLRRSNAMDAVEYKMVDYAEIPDAPTLIDVKGPVLENSGVFYDTATSASVGVLQDRVEGLAISAVKKVKANAILTPPIPTVVVLDLFNLSGSEKLLVRTKLQAEAATWSVDLSKIIIIE